MERTPGRGRPLEGATEEEPSDNELVERIVAGDEEAFVSLYRRWRAPLHRFATGMTGSPATADDVVQETFMIVMREAARYDASRGTVGAYLRGIARHLVFRSIRQWSRLVALAEAHLHGRAGVAASNPDPASILIQTEEVRRVHAALLAVTPRLREALVLCDLQGMSYAEAADALRVPIGTVRSRLSRGREALAGRLQERAREIPAWKRVLVRPTP